jgi:hypothetical protein
LTKPGEQAQVDFGHFPFLTPDGQRHWYWGFVMVLAWSRCSTSSSSAAPTSRASSGAT